MNFVNRNNQADQRVFQLLAEKFSLFEGVFGASDEVLGAIESGVDFEKRIAAIYQRCRTPEEIRASFDQLQTELNVEIDQAMTKTRRQLLENFDEEVHEKLRIRKTESESFQNRYERMLMRLSRHELGSAAEFADGDGAFELKANPYPDLDIPLGRYELPRRSGDVHLWLTPAEVVFDYWNSVPRVAALEPYLKQSGELLVCRLSVESMDQAEDHLLVAALTDEGKLLDDTFSRRFFALSAVEVREQAAHAPAGSLVQEIERQQAAIRKSIAERNGRLFEEEANKLDDWADDLKVGLERDIKDLDRQMKEARRAAASFVTLEEKLAGQRRVKALEGERNAKRKALYDAQDEIEARRDALIRNVEGKLEQKTELEPLLAIRWRLV